MFGQKYFLFAFLLWLAIIVLSSIAEYSINPSGGTAFIGMLWNSTSMIATIAGGTLAVGATLLVPNGGKAVMLIVTLTLLAVVRNFIILDFPTIFYGSYEWFRWIFVAYGVVVFFVSPIMGRFVSGG